MRYTARLTGNKRDVNLMNPLALMVDIEKEDGSVFRDHSWITLNKEISDIQPKGHEKPILVSFTAKEKKYLKNGQEESLTLFKIKNISKIKDR